MNRGPVIFAKYNSRWCDGAGRGDAWSGGRRGRTKEKRHRIDWFGEGRTEKGSEKGRARERMGDKKKESWIKERKTLKGFRRKRGDLAEVRQTLDGYVGEVRDDLGAIRLSFGHHCCKNTRGGQHYHFLTIKIFHFSLHWRNSYLGFRRCWTTKTEFTVFKVVWVESRLLESWRSRTTKQVILHSL